MPYNKREVTSLRYTGFPGQLDLLRRSEKTGLTLTVGGDYAEDTQNTLPQNTRKIQFPCHRPDNLKSCEIASYRESYRAGVPAASATKTRRVGILPGTHVRSARRIPEGNYHRGSCSRSLHDR